MKKYPRLRSCGKKQRTRLRFEVLESRQLLTAATDVALHVNLGTGDATMVFSNSPAMVAYQIESPGGHLLPANWKSLSSQGQSAWTPMPSSTSFIAEVMLSGSAVSSTTVDLGNIFSVNSTRDLTFDWGTNGSSTPYISNVVYDTAPATATTTTLTASPNPSAFGQSVTFTATVAPASGSGTPTGTVQFAYDGTSLGSPVAVDASGRANSPAIASLGVGTHSITAVYNGDGKFATSTSTALTQTVSQAGTTTAVASSAGPSTFGQSVTFTATVLATGPGSGTPSGTVQFAYDGTSLGSPVAVDASGHARSPAISSLGVGTHSITAVYNGDGKFTTSTSTALTQTVGQAGTTTVVASSANPSASGQSLTCTATVAAASPGSGTPTGTVQFAYDGTNLGSPVPLDNSGHAQSPAIADLGVGTHSMTAVYNGDANFTTSTSAALTQTVNNNNPGTTATTTTMTSSRSPSVFGQSVTCTATVVSKVRGKGTPTGTVQFAYDGENLGSPVPLDRSGHAQSPAMTDLGVGTHSITAVYNGNATFTTSTSAAWTQTVHKASTKTTFSLSSSRSLVGESITLTATVNVTGSGAGVPGGSVQFVDGQRNLGAAVPLDGSGHATLSISTLGPGRHRLKAVYAGDPSFKGSNSNTVTEVVRRNDGDNDADDRETASGAPPTPTAPESNTLPPAKNGSLLDKSALLAILSQAHRAKLVAPAAAHAVDRVFASF
jgi:hypothetical protein